MALFNVADVLSDKERTSLLLYMFLGAELKMQDDKHGGLTPVRDPGDAIRTV